MLDEFGTIGKLNAVAQAYGLMAGLGMIMWAFAQDLNQLKRDYPEHWETFIGNSQAVTCFGVMDNFTADYISKMLGTATIEQVNVSTSMARRLRPAQRTHRSGQISENVGSNFDQLLDADDEPSAPASRRDPRPGRRAVASSWATSRRLSAGGSCITRIGISCTARGPIRTFPAPRGALAGAAVTGSTRWVRSRGCSRSTATKSKRSGADDMKCKLTEKGVHTFASGNDLWRWTYRAGDGRRGLCGIG